MCYTSDWNGNCCFLSVIDWVIFSQSTYIKKIFQNVGISYALEGSKINFYQLIWEDTLFAQFLSAAAHLFCSTYVCSVLYLIFKSSVYNSKCLMCNIFHTSNFIRFQKKKDKIVWLKPDGGIHFVTITFLLYNAEILRCYLFSVSTFWCSVSRNTYYMNFKLMVILFGVFLLTSGINWKKQYYWIQVI